MTERSAAIRKRSRAAASATLRSPPRLQVGALTFRRTAKGLRVLLITSRDTGRWVIPKGWPMRNRSEAEAAAREAFEEAGVKGTIGEQSIGHYTYPKLLANGGFVPCFVRIYPLEATERVKSFPELGERKRRWFKPGKAARRVMEPELARLIREFDPERSNTIAET